MASYTHNGKLWRNNENHGMTKVLAPFIISINKKIYWYKQAFRIATCHHTHSQKSGKIVKQLYFANTALLEAEMCFRIENQYTNRMIIFFMTSFPLAMTFIALDSQYTTITGF